MRRLCVLGGVGSKRAVREVLPRDASGCSQAAHSPQICRHAHELPLRCNAVQAPQAELAEAQHTLDPAVGWLGDALSSSVDCLAGLGEALPSRLLEVEYGTHDIVRRVQYGGRVIFAGQVFRVGKGLVGLPVALRPHLDHDGVFDVYFCHPKVDVIDLARAC